MHEAYSSGEGPTRVVRGVPRGASHAVAGFFALDRELADAARSAKPKIRCSELCSAVINVWLYETARGRIAAGPRNRRPQARILPGAL